MLCALLLMLEKLVSEAAIYLLHGLEKVSTSPSFSSLLNKMGMVILVWHKCWGSLIKPMDVKVPMFHFTFSPRSFQVGIYKAICSPTQHSEAYFILSWEGPSSVSLPYPQPVDFIETTPESSSSLGKYYQISLHLYGTLWQAKRP